MVRRLPHTLRICGKLSAVGGMAIVYALIATDQGYCIYPSYTAYMPARSTQHRTHLLATTRVIRELVAGLAHSTQ